MNRQRNENESAIDDSVNTDNLHVTNALNRGEIFDTLLDKNCEIEKLPQTGQKCFGLSVQKAISTSPFLYQGFRVPILIYRCIEYLDCTESLAKDGIFRYGAPKDMIDKLESEFDELGDVDLTQLPQECVLTISQQETYDKWKAEKKEEQLQQQQQKQSQQQDDAKSLSPGTYNENGSSEQVAFPVPMKTTDSSSSFTSETKGFLPSRPRRLSRTSIHRERGLSASTINTTESLLSGNTTDYASSINRRGSNYEDIIEEPEGNELIVSSHAVATLMKRYLRKLQTHLIDKSVARRIQKILDKDMGETDAADIQKKEEIRKVLGTLESSKLSVLICVLRYLDRVLEFSETNKISVNGLAVLFNANLTDDFKGENLTVFTELLSNRSFYFIDGESIEFYKKYYKERGLEDQLGDMDLSNEDGDYDNDDISNLKNEFETDDKSISSSTITQATRETNNSNITKSKSCASSRFSSSANSSMNTNFKKWMDKFRKNSKS